MNAVLFFLNQTDIGCEMVEKPLHPSFQRLIDAAKDHGIETRNDLFSALGQTKFTVNNWAKRGVSKDGALIAQSKFGCSSLWILFGKDEDSKSNIVDIGNFRDKKQPDELLIPEYNTGGAMGSGVLLRDQPGVIRGWSVNQEWVQKNVKSHTGAQNLCIVTGFGDSMKGMFNPGDPLLVDRGVTVVEYDAVYFFRVDGEGFIKRLQRIPGEGLRVLSENKKYESWTIKAGMDFEVFGRVLKAWQGEDF